MQGENGYILTPPPRGRKINLSWEPRLAGISGHGVYLYIAKAEPPHKKIRQREWVPTPGRPKDGLYRHIL